MDEGALQVAAGMAPRLTDGAWKPLRRMLRAELLGAHTHQTVCGIEVHVWLRDGKFLARGSYQGRRFGETLGGDSVTAASALRHLLVRLENGTYVRPSEARRQAFKVRRPLRSTMRELANAYLAEKRRLCGHETARDYQCRLAPVIEFAEQPDSLRRWPLAQQIDREFAMELRTFLLRRHVGRNGSPSADQHAMSPRQVYNVLDCARSMFHWARRPEVGQLPVAFAQPFTPEIVGQRRRRDPLQPPKLPLELRCQLVGGMDVWQVAHFALSFVLPLRPEDVTGLLITEVDWQRRQLRFGTRLGGRDFNKGRLDFQIPFPAELVPLISVCRGGREAGPLLRRRAIFEGRQSPQVVCQPSEVPAHLERAASTVALPGGLQAPQDCKVAVRRALLELGAASPNDLSREFQKLVFHCGAPRGIRFYDLRGSVTTELDRAGVSHLVTRYVTGHTTDILNEYVSLDVTSALQPYFMAIRPLLDALTHRAAALRI
jgi:hypothetical protein